MTVSTALGQSEVTEDKVYAVLFASWRDGSWWVGEAHGNDGLGTYVLCFSGCGGQSESGNRADAKDPAPVADGVHFLAAQRAAEVERRLPTDGPPVMLDAVIEESGDPLKLKALLEKRERAWQRVGFGRLHPVWFAALGCALPPLAVILLSRLRPSWLSLRIGVLTMCLGLAAGPLLMLVQSWQVKRLRQKTWRNGPATPVLCSLLAVNVAVFALELLWGGSDSALTLYRMGAGLGRVGLLHEPWRLVSAAFLHVNVLHLSLNMWALFVLGRMLESVLGSRRFVVLYALSAAAGGLASAVVHPQILSAGASGAVWGLMTAQVAMVLRLRRQEGAERVPVSMTRLLLPLVVNLLISLIPRVDMAAHLGGGFAGAGLVLSGIIEWRRPEVATWRPAAWGASLAMAACLVVALTHGRPWELRWPPLLVPRAIPDTPVVVSVPSGLPPWPSDEQSAMVFGRDGSAPLAVYCKAGRLSKCQPGSLSQMAHDEAARSLEEGESWDQKPRVVRLRFRPAVFSSTRLQWGGRVQSWLIVDGSWWVRLDVVLRPDTPASWAILPSAIADGIAIFPGGS